jgi:hypothetical protein
MKRKAFIITIVLGLLAGSLLLVASPAAVEAQGNSPVTAEVDRTSLTTDETLLLTVSVDTASGNPSPPVLSALDGFDVLGSSSGTQITIVNGDMRMQASYQYQLRPTRAGELVIGPITVEVNGQTYQTAPATISVAQGTGQPQPAQPTMPQFPSLPGMPNIPGMPSIPGMPPSAPSQPSAPAGSIPPPEQLNGQEFYAEATVDNPSPYQGEQVIYTFRFYQGTNLLDQPVYQPPTFTGFWHESQPEQTTYTTEASGRSYYVTEIQTALFPTVSGKLTIVPARLEIPGGFFSQGQRFETQPLTLSVQTLPPNAPASFRGAVGQFTIQSSADTAESKVNDAVTLNVTVEGQGNLETLGELEWNVGAEWRAFDSQSASESQFANGRLTSRRTYEQVLLPTAVGDLTLPVVEFSYFDPATGQYETIQTEPITVRVQADGNAPVAAAPPSTQSPAVVPVNAVALDTAALRPLKAAPATWANGRALVEQTGYWLLWTVPLFVLTGHAGWQWWQKRHDNSADVRLSQQAGKKAYRSMQVARRQPAGQDAALILTTYLAEKLNRPLTGLTHEGLRTQLQAEGIPSELAARVQTCLEASDAGRYMPNAAETAADQLQETEHLIRELEKVL